MLHSSQLCPTPFPLKTSTPFSDISKELCKSSVSSSSPSEYLLQAQITQLKEKAHQSFMQVIQIQQLHDEELDLLREEHSQREIELQQKIHELEERLSRSEQLELRVQQLEYENSAMEKNYKMHFCEMDDDLSIDNIEIITLQHQPIDESSIAYFQEVFNLYQREEEFETDKAKLVDEIRVVHANSFGSGSSISTLEQSPLFILTTKILVYVSCIRSEWIKMLERERQREKDNQAAKEVSDHNGFKQLQRECKFMADHIKRLAGEKLKAEKQVTEMERQLQALEEKMRKVENHLLKRGIQLDELPKKKLPNIINQNDISLELNEFISENLKNSSNINPHPQSNLKPHQGLLRNHKH